MDTLELSAETQGGPAVGMLADPRGMALTAPCRSGRRTHCQPLMHML